MAPIRWMLTAALIAVFCSPALALTGAEIMDKADKANRSKDEATVTVMKIRNDKGHERERKMLNRKKAGAGDDDKIIIRFLEPTTLAGSGLLTIEEGAGDQQWLFLKELKKVKKIAGASKAGAFMGSNFSMYDMRTEDLKGHNYKLLGEETHGRTLYRVEATPKTKEVAEATGYSKRVVFVDKERWTVVRVDYFDSKGKALKTLVASKWKQHKKLWRADKVLMMSKLDKSKTLLLPQSRKINEGLDDSAFSKRELQKEI